MVAGVKVATVEGTPQGSPLSPLLANIMLDDLDHELERRGHTFVRYADDLRVYVASERAATRVLDGVTVFVERRLKLKVNRTKSGVAPATRRGLLGFGFFVRDGKVRVRLEHKTTRASEGSTTPAHLPAPEHRDADEACRCSTGSSVAGPPTSRWPTRRRSSPSSTSGSDAGCGRSAGRSGSALPRGGATSGRSVSPTGRRANGRPAGRATGGWRAPLRSSGRCPTGTGPTSVWSRSATGPSPPGALANRRMRTRTSGGVGGGGVTPPPTRSRATERSGERLADLVRDVTCEREIVQVEPAREDVGEDAISADDEELVLLVVEVR